MKDIEIGFEIAKLVAQIIGAVIAVWYWNREKHKLEQYRYLDEAYNEILKAYHDKPEFGQPDLTSKYAEVFKGPDFWRYHYFSMRVHTFLESIFDLSKGKIPDAWVHIFQHHANLHFAWLRDHRGLHEPGYVQRVISTP